MHSLILLFQKVFKICASCCTYKYKYLNDLYLTNSLIPIINEYTLQNLRYKISTTFIHRCNIGRKNVFFLY